MAGQIILLASEIANDPVGAGYAAMTNLEIAESINSKVISKNKTSLSAKELLEAIDSGELLGLTGDKAVRVWGILSIDSIDPFGVAVSIFIDAFGAGSATITALASLRTKLVSRANILGYPGEVKEGHVEMAKAKGV